MTSIIAQHNSSLHTRMLILEADAHLDATKGASNVNTWQLPDELVSKYGIKHRGGKYMVGTLIRVNKSLFSEQQLVTLGGKIITRIGTIYSIDVPVEQLVNVSKLSGVEYVEIGQKVSLCMDEVRKDTRANWVNSGYQMPLPYNGKGVIIGIVDDGFDFTHPHFKDSSGQHLRISRVWSQADTSGTAPIGFAYGTELTTEAEILQAKTDLEYSSHGTHVAGIAAGSDYGSNGKYRGIASESELVEVALDFSRNSVGIVDAFDYMCRYADNQSKPVVVNMSLALSGGSNDGTSLFESSIDSLISDKHLLVVAAGNNFDNYNMHIEKNTVPVVDTLRTLFQFISGEEVEIWSDKNATLSMSVSFYTSDGIKIAESPFYSTITNPSIQTKYAVGTDNDTITISILGQHISVLNQKSSFLINANSKNFNTYYCMISVRSDIGNIHAWNISQTGFYNSINGTSVANAKNGDENYTIFPPGTVKNAITVGAYTTKNSCTYLTGNTEPITYFSDSGAIAPFSKKGPCLGGYLKPDITAPGNVVVSSVNRADTYYADSNHSVHIFNDTWYFAPMNGTSMATPVIAGVVALMLEANPELTRNEIVNILKITSRQDAFTGNIPGSGSTQWGWGKIDAYSAVIGAYNLAVKDGIHKIPDFLIYPNPATEVLTVISRLHVTSNVSVSMYSISGELILHEQMHSNNSFQIPLISYRAGVYILKIETNAGVEIHKVIVK
ncbi:MAG: S8/S53 family peptidase [Bacteroidota bacterium]